MDPLATAPTSPGGTDPGRRGRSWGYLAVGIVVVVGALAAILSGAWVHQIDLSVKRQPAPYASLYFTSPGALPSDLPSGRSYPVAFTVGNNDVQPRTFRYQVTLTTPGGRKTVVGQVAVPSGGSTPQTVDVTPTQACAPCQVMVALPTEHAAISFRAGSAP